MSHAVTAVAENTSGLFFRHHAVREAPRKHAVAVKGKHHISFPKEAVKFGMVWKVVFHHQAVHEINIRMPAIPVNRRSINSDCLYHAVWIFGGRWYGGRLRSTIIREPMPALQG